MFSLDNLIADCQKAVAGGRTAQAEVRDILTKAVSEPESVLKELGEPEKGGVVKLHDSDDLTIINVIWAPHMTIMPHNHECEPIRPISRIVHSFGWKLFAFFQ